MREDVIEAVLKRYDNINLDVEIINNLYDKMKIELSKYKVENLDILYYFEFSKLIDKYLINEIKKGNDEIKLTFILSNYFLINRIMNKYEFINKKEGIRLGEEAVEQSIIEYDDTELFSVQAVRKLTKVFKKSF